MRKIIFILSFILFFFTFFTPVKAEIITLRQNGEIIINVLSFEDSLGVPKKESLEITGVTNENNVGQKDKILLAKEGEEFKLNIFSSEGNKELDVTNIKGDLIEIEERPTVKNLKIGVLNGNFYLQEGGILAKTVYPISIDSKNAEISIKTDSGEHFIAISPVDAYQFCLRAKNLTKLNDQDIFITEKNVGEVAYEIPGEKTLDFFGLVKYDIPVKVSVSALTGEVLRVEQEPWMRVLSFFFS